MALALLSIPFSNCEVERVFSQYKLIKTAIRNSLATDTIQGLLMMKTFNFDEYLNDETIINELSSNYVKYVNGRLAKKDPSENKRKSDLITSSSITQINSQFESEEDESLQFASRKKPKSSINAEDNDKEVNQNEIQTVKIVVENPKLRLEIKDSNNGIKEIKDSNSGIREIQDSNSEIKEIKESDDQWYLIS